MKRRALYYLPSAQLDLEEIFQYIERESPGGASALLEKIDRALNRLQSFPESGAVPKDKRLAALGYRIVVIGEFLAFYVCRANRVEIRRVLHGRRRYSFLL